MEMGELDMEHRNPHDLNNGLSIVFEDVLGEPDGAYSIDYVWANSYICFNCAKTCCYKLFTALFGVCIALFWGLQFAVITFEQTWCFTPALKITQVYTDCVRKFFSQCTTCWITPICEACSLCFSKITVNKTGQ